MNRSKTRHSSLTRCARFDLSSVVASLLALACGLSGCADSGTNDGATNVAASTAESCMTCHNGGNHDDYSGGGIENPHPFPGAGTLSCTTCHGGNPDAGKKEKAHVPPPPQIGDRNFQEQNNLAYFNRLTLTGIDKYADYDVDGVTYTAIDYLQFINPGDLRVVTQGRSCGVCHTLHSEYTARGLLATEAGIFSGARYAIGAENAIPANQGLYQDTASDFAFRAVTDPSFVFDAANVGAVGSLDEYPVYSVNNAAGPLDIFRNAAYSSPDLNNDFNADGSVITDSPLAVLFHEQVAFTCGDCHLGSAGANNRYGDFRSSGCTACHMPYSLDGRSRSGDPKVKKKEPKDPDDIEAPERPHIRRHLITSVAKTLTTGEFVQGMDDYTCAGCHQGSNRTVMQYWGIRLDQNRDVVRRRQYPTNPRTFLTTANDTRLFDRKVKNRTFNGRNPAQYILFEDYDDDGRDDTPPDVHYEAGMGCIDCHGSHDLHGGNVGDPNDASVYSRQEQAVAIRCESCHGTIDAYATVAAGVTYDGQVADLAMDAEGHPLKHVVRESSGEYWLTSRLTGERHYIPQTKDTVYDNGTLHPETNQPIYNVRASYAMGRNDGDPATGMGPLQTDGAKISNNFSHTTEMSCVACHASWTNNCIGCHLGGEYQEGGGFSNITGQRIAFRQADADFVYQNPVLFHLGVDTHNKIAPISPNTEAFFKYEDLDGVFSDVFAFSDRNGGGNNTLSSTHPAMSHNVMMPHSIRGRSTLQYEGARQCVACHLTQEAIDDWGVEYDTFRTAMEARDFASVDQPLLAQHIGANTGNDLNSPFWVHSVVGLGSGLFLFDTIGCPTNDVDIDTNRFGCNGQSPKDRFDITTFNADAIYNLDRLVERSGASNGSNNHSMLEPGVGTNKRDGAANQNLSGPLGASLIEKLSDPTNGLILDSWLDANGGSGGDASDFVGP